MNKSQISLPICPGPFNAMGPILLTIYTVITTLLVLFVAFKLVMAYRKKAYAKPNYKKLIIMLIITLIIAVPGRLLFKNILTLIPSIQMCDLS